MSLLPRLGAVLLVLVVTAGCSWTDDRRTTDDPDPAVVPVGEISPEHNDTDVAFAHEMTAHLQQALFLVELTAAREASPELAKLSTVIGRDRTEEVDALSRLLRTWRVPAHGNHRHDNPGTMSGDELTEVFHASGAALESRWVALLTANHEGAIAMARAELAEGSNLAARELARAMIERLARTLAGLAELGASQP